MTFYIPQLSIKSDSTTVQSFNQFGNRRESGTITVVAKLSTYRRYLTGFYGMELIGKIRVNVFYNRGSEFVTILVDYSNKRDFDAIYDYRINEKTMDQFKRDRFVELVKKTKNSHQVARLWNYADHCDDCEELFNCLAALRPECFDDPHDVNTFRFPATV
jgi:hypothetical protein